MAFPNTREFLNLAAALAAGFLGGHIHLGAIPAAAADDGVLRPQRIELVNANGRTLASLGPDNAGNAVLRFFNRSGNELLDLGLRPPGSPYLDMLAADSKVRLAMRLEGAGQRPMLGMGDSQYEGRAMLGFYPSDTSGGGGNWGLLFQAPQKHPAVASLAILPDGSSGHLSARLALLGEKDRLWLAPK